VDQATRHASAAAVIAAEVADQGFGYLKAPVKLVTALDATVPYSQPMEEYLLPDEKKIAAAVRAVIP
jgi:pyruvate dehydrogenase E1 component beta subunit